MAPVSSRAEARATATARRGTGKADRVKAAKRFSKLSRGVGVRGGRHGLMFRVESEVTFGMDRFVSTFTNKIDAKGRVSIPASFRAVLEHEGNRLTGGGIYCYPSLDAPALDAGGERLAKKIDGLLSSLPDYSDERDELSVALYGDVHVLAIDGDGRIVLPESLREHAGFSTHVTFVGLGDKFQMWEPKRFEGRRKRAREKAQSHRTLFGAGNRSPRGRGSGSEGARE